MKFHELLWNLNWKFWIQNFIKIHEIPLKISGKIMNFAKVHKSSWNFMKFYEISRTFMKFKFEILNSKFHKSSWNYMQNFIKVHEISSFIGPK